MVCTAACCLSPLLRVSPAAAWVAAESENSAAMAFLAAEAAPPARLLPPPTPAAEVGLQLRGLTRVLPQDPNPVQLQIPPDVTEEELKGSYGFALALSIFSGLLIMATLVLLFGLWARERWFDRAAPSQRPSPGRRSSLGQR